MALSKRNEFVAGIFILLCLALLAAVLVTIGNWSELTEKKAVYYVTFDNVPMLREGSTVALHGMPVGRVSEINLQWKTVKTETGEARKAYFLLAIQVPRDIVLSSGANIRIDAPFIGEDSVVNIASVGEGGPAGKTAATAIAGTGHTYMESMAEALGIGQKQKDEIAAMIADTKATLADARAMVAELHPTIKSAVDNIEKSTGQLREKLPGIMTGVQESVAKMKDATTEINDMLKANRPKIDDTIARINTLATTAEDKATELIKNLAATSDDVRTLVAANRSNISDTMINLRQTSEQLKAASIEIRRSPWRLLRKPSEQESDSLNIFDAARSYANAAADLRTTAATLKTLLELKQKNVPVNDAVIDDMVNRLQAGFKKYDEAEKALWKEWNQTSQ